MFVRNVSVQYNKNLYKKMKQSNISYVSCFMYRK